MSKPDPDSTKKEKLKTARWVAIIFFVTIFVSGLISMISEEIMDGSSIFAAFLILLSIVFIGIVFDVVGVAVTSADEAPFHAMAARKVPGAREAIKLLRRVDKVSSICNDVVGDICGVVSGSASATIAVQLLQHMDLSWPRIVGLLMSAFVAGLTVGGKALGKTVAVKSSTSIVHFVGKILCWFGNISLIFRTKNMK